jgi:DNA polymerase-3 subunit chi
VQVDFYQLAGTPAEHVIASLGEKVLSSDGRLVVVAEDELFLARLDRMLWDVQPANFLAHAMAGGADDARQPILLSTSPDAPNLARNLLIADAVWREAALTYDRTFYLFGTASLKPARAAWKALAAREGVERRYWAQAGGKWKQQA